MAKATATPKKKVSSAKKKAAPKRKAAGKKSTAAANRKAATAKHANLAKKLREDLQATKDTLKAVRDSARAEIAVLKDHLNAAMKREAALQKIAESKVKAMVAAGEKWEREQMAKVRKLTAKIKAKPKKKAAKKSARKKSR